MRCARVMIETVPDGRGVAEPAAFDTSQQVSVMGEVGTTRAEVREEIMRLVDHLLEITIPE